MVKAGAKFFIPLAVKGSVEGVAGGRRGWGGERRNERRPDLHFCYSYSGDTSCAGRLLIF